MESLNSLLEALDEATIVRKIQIPHDEARNHFRLDSNTVGSFDEFSRVIGDYYNFHFSRCLSRGGRLSTAEAAGRAKEILVREYRRRGGDIVAAFRDAEEGREGGLREILDKIADALKAEAVERYTRAMFDRHVAPSEWGQKVAILRQFIAKFGHVLGHSIDRDEPERYAANYEELIRSFLSGMQQTSAVFRRM